MIDLTLTVTLQDGETFTVRPKLSTFVKFERQYKTSVTTAFASDNVSLEHLTWVAWEQARRDGVAVPPFETFVEKLDDIDPAVEQVPLAATA